jgi:hypothetical protein
MGLIQAPFANTKIYFCINSLLIMFLRTSKRYGEFLRAGTKHKVN